MPDQAEKNEKRAVKFTEFSIPPTGNSPITGLPDTPVWGSLNKPAQTSRWAIGDADSDDEFNFLPMGGQKFQLPGPGTTLATLASPVVWLTSFFFNGGAFMFALTSNGHLYQISSAGVITDVYASAQTSQNGGCTNGSQIVTGLNTTNLSVGMGVSGTGIPVNDTILSIDSGTQIHLASAFTGTTGSVSLSFSTPLFTTSGVVDIACWQGTTMLISDSAAQKVYSWNGTNMLIVFNSQPVNYIAVFQNRLWMGVNSTIQWTNVNTFNSLTGDSGSYLITDSNCTNPVNCMLDTAYGLLISGANWFKVISNLADTGIPAVLTFQQNTIEANVGIFSKWTVIQVGNAVFFANTAGIWEFQGSQPIQISAGPLNGFFANLDFTKTTLSASYGVINGFPCIFYQAYYKGDTQVSAAYTVFGYTLESTQWFRYVNGTVSWITSLAAQTSTNSTPIVWGSDGTNIFTLFTNPSATLTCQYNSKLWSLGSALDYDNILGVAIELIFTNQATITVSYLNETNVVQSNRVPQVSPAPGVLTWVNNSGQVIQFVNNSSAAINFTSNLGASYFLFQDDGLGRCRRFGLNVKIVGSGIALNSIVLSVHKTGASTGH